jgi:RHS repeat-associated core domain
MSTDTSGSPVSLAEQATVPTLRHFQMDTDAIGDLETNLNLFAGKVVMPIELLNLQNRGGLSVSVNLGYSSDVAAGVHAWNVVSPTGPVGLGWSMGADVIERDIQGSLAPYDDAYYIRSSEGDATQLHLTAHTVDEWRFETESYDFSTVRYWPAQDCWEVTSANGLVRRFGGTANSRQQGIYWGGARGNWSGASTQLAQSGYTVAWNLDSITNTFGDSILFEYTEFSDDEIRIGPSGGSTYTRAKYLKLIRDPAGREVLFTYLEKEYNDHVREYQPPHKEAGPTHAYQDRYETRYLHHIEVTQSHPGGVTPVLSVYLCYAVACHSQAAGDRRYLYKRYLTGFAFVNSLGKLMPGMRFEYETRGEAEYATGALIRTISAAGAVVDYEYERRPISGTALKHVARRDETGSGVPRLWVGPNYTVLLRYDAQAQHRLVVNVYDWNGAWRPYRAIDSRLPGGMDLAEIRIELQEDFFALSYRLSGGAQAEAIHCHVVRRRFGQYGVWDTQSLDMPRLPQPGAAYAIATGEQFIVAAVDDVPAVKRYAWDARQLLWVGSEFDTGGRGAYLLTGGGWNMMVCRHDPTTGLAELQLLSLEAGLRFWRNTRLDIIAPVAWTKDIPPPSLAVAETFASAVFINRLDPDRKTFDYEIRLYRWDRDLLNPIIERRFYPRIPADIEAPLITASAVGSLLGSAQHLFRFNGNQWVEADLGDFSGKQRPQFAYGDDIALVTSGLDTLVVSYRPDLDSGRFERTLELRHAPGPQQPTIAGNYLTIGNRIYYRQPDATLRYLRDLPADAKNIANDGDRFIAYDLPDGRSYVLLLKNGQISRLALQLVGRLFVPDAAASGSFLLGPTAFATFTGPNFDAAEEIHLHRCLHNAIEGAIQDYVVVKARLNPGVGERHCTTLHYASSGTTGPFGLSAQYRQVKLQRGTDSDMVAFGQERHTFFDGLAPPEASDTGPYALFNGLLRTRELMDKTGTLLQRIENTWEATRQVEDARTGTQIALVGAYIRQTGQETRHFDAQQPGIWLSQQRLTRFHPANGLPREVTENNIDGDDNEQRLTTTSGFAFEYYPALAALNCLDSVALTQKAVNGESVGQAAVLWSRTWTDGLNAWAPRSSLRARKAQARLTQAQWNGQEEPSLADWFLEQTILRRDAYGTPLALRDGSGLISSLQLDAQGRYAVAAWTGADRHAGQAGYLGFEPDENIAPWTLRGTEAGLRAAIIPGDAHAGQRALRIAGGTLTGAGLRYASTVSEAVTRRYVAAAWIKTAANADSAEFSAHLNILAGSSLSQLPLVATEGMWTYVWVFVDVAGSSQPQALQVEVDNPGNVALLVDDIRFGPAECDFKATIWESAPVRPIATLASSGQTRRKLYDDFEQVSTDIDDGFAVVTTWTPSQSWPTAPAGGEDMRWNTLLTVRPQTWGFQQSFTLGEDWRAGWAGDLQAFEWAADRLEHRSNTAAYIRYNDIGPTTGDWGITARAFPSVTAGAPVGAYGLIVGDICLRADDAAACWQVVRTEDGAELARVSFDEILQLPLSCTPSLDQGSLSDEAHTIFMRYAAPLPSQTVIYVMEAGKRWRIEANGTPGWCYELAMGTTGVKVCRRETNLALLVLGHAVMAMADGKRLCVLHRQTMPEPVPGLMAATMVAFDQVILLTHPQVGMDYQDGAILTRQSHVLAEDAVVATARIYDGMGRATVTSQGAQLSADDAALFAYRTDLAMYDAASAQLTGIVAEQNPESAGFAYARSRYEASPLGRSIQKGLPGIPFAIPADESEGHTTRTVYGLSDGRFGERVGAYFRTETWAPDGERVIKLTDLREQTVLEAALISNDPPVYYHSRRRHDKAGRLVELQSPMGWSDRFEYNYLGQSTLTRYANDAADHRYVYDLAGRLRFTQGPDGSIASPGYFKWLKYDGFSRVIAEGIAPGPFDPQTLQVHAENPQWPDLIPHLANEYDGLWRADLLAIGLLSRTKRQRQNKALEDADPVIIEEEKFYDIWVQTIAQVIRIQGAAMNGEWRVNYDYDNQGHWTAIHYPASDDTPELTVEQTFDRVGRIGRLAWQNQTHAYRYDRNGLLTNETWTPANGAPIRRQLQHNSAAWITTISDPGLRQQISYTEGGVGGHGFYSGKPASIHIGARDVIPAWTMRLNYDQRGMLSACAIENAVADVYEYDRNGNMIRQGAKILNYTQDQRDRTQSVEGLQGGSQWGYRADGAVRVQQASRPDDTLTLDYDLLNGAVLGMARGIVGTQNNQQLRYDAAARRILRTADRLSTVYIRSLTGDPLLELRSNGTRCWYIQGPSGPAVLGNGQEWAYLSRDHLGSIRAIVDAQSNIVAGYDYTPFGAALRSVFGSQRLATSYRFIARELDPVGIYDMRARAYDAAVGRFLSQDPRHQQASPYAYSNNSPLFLEDPEGEELIAFLIGLLVGAAIGATVGAAAGAISAAVAISTNKLEGGEAAKVFFGFVGLGLAVGAVSGGISGGVGALLPPVASGGSAILNLGISVGVGTVSGAALGAAESAGQAALLGENVGTAAWQGAITSGLSAGIGGLFSEGFEPALRHFKYRNAPRANNVLTGHTRSAAHYAPRSRQSIVAGTLLGAVAGGTVSGGIAGAINGESAGDTFLGMLQAVGFGLIGSLPEVVRNKPWHRRPQAPTQRREQPGRNSTMDNVLTEMRELNLPRK